MPQDLPEYRLRKVDVRPKLTGLISEPPWPDLPSFGPLVLLGTESTPAPCRTEVKACWDEQFLYILWHCEDEAVRATLTARDAPLWEEEVVEVFLCPHGNLSEYFEFNFNPLGAVFDARVTNPDCRRGAGFRADVAWNCEGLEWVVAGEGRFNGTTESDKWWAVEAAIPFSGLHADVPEPGQAWRANVFRIERTDPPQFCTWSPLPDAGPGFHQSERFGLWIFEA